MRANRYETEEYARMVAWTSEIMAPYILQELFPKYENEHLLLKLEESAEQHVRIVSASNTELFMALRSQDIEAVAVMMAELREGLLVDKIFTSPRAYTVKERRKLVEVQYKAGAKSKAVWAE